MKKGSLILKIFAAALVMVMALSMLASCGTNAVVMSIDKDGKTYTISEKEFGLLMKIEKLNICCNALITRQTDKITLWANKDEETGKTYEEICKEQIVNRAKAILVEKYLFEKNGLTLPQDELNEYKDSLKTQVKQVGGIGAYKQYYGYTDGEYFDIYVKMILRSEAVIEALYGENGAEKVTAEDLDAFYKENYTGYQFIMLDMENKVTVDENGKRVIKTVKDKDGKEVDGEEYETEALTAEEKESKQTLAKAILAELEGGKTFEEMVEKYSDDYFSVEYPEGMFLPKENTFISDAVMDKIKDLKEGEYTTEEISINGNKNQYIVKKVALKDKVYEDEKYVELFEGYEDSVKYDKYNNFIEEQFQNVVIAEEVAAKYTLAETFLSKYADYYYQQYLSQYYNPGA